MNMFSNTYDVACVHCDLGFGADKDNMPVRCYSGADATSCLKRDLTGRVRFYLSAIASKCSFTHGGIA